MSPDQTKFTSSSRAGAVETKAGVTLPLPEPRGADNGRHVAYGVRPEHLMLGPDGSGITVEVSVVEPTGSETLVVGRAGGEEILAVFHERHSFDPGEHIHLVPDLDHVHLFAREGGTRLQS